MDTPDAMMYASVVSLESVWIALLIAALNNLDLLPSHVHNAYLNTIPREEAWLKSKLEFCQYEGRVFVIVQSLYGMASPAAIWQNE